ncbi:hypothetical protein V7111_23500 [Neobacillus niacini]|uniref:hypothetical protein n=1 Tax=Neobacillus niacini TaxID=86668 RepID=UPI0030033730
MENKEKFLQFISEAIDNGADISVSFYISSELSENKAEEKAVEFTNLVGGEVTEEKGQNFRWFKVNGDRFDLSAFHANSHDKKYMVEDVDLTGGEEIA